MPTRKKVKVIKKNATGRNKRFQDQSTRKKMSLSEFVKAIKRGQYPNYHIRKIRDIDTPVSNPDKKTNNNLD